MQHIFNSSSQCTNVMWSSRCLEDQCLSSDKICIKTNKFLTPKNKNKNNRIPHCVLLFAPALRWVAFMYLSCLTGPLLLCLSRTLSWCSSCPPWSCGQSRLYSLASSTTRISGSVIGQGEDAVCSCWSITSQQHRRSYRTGTELWPTLLIWAYVLLGRKTPTDNLWQCTLVATL